jgi:CBS domain containing-hemolysin-like protein
VIVSSSLLVGWLLNSFCREAAGSGIPQVKLAFWKEPTVTCLRGQTIQDLQQLLLDSTTQFVVVLDQMGGKVVGVVTLHDLLRSQTAAAERVAESGVTTGGL